MLLFGGGHAAVPRTDVDTFNLTNFTWKSAYTPTPVSDLVFTNFDQITGGWKTTGHPMSRHTYDMLTFAPNTNELILLMGVGPAPNCQKFQTGITGDWNQWP
jgi:hypothetical protein